MKKTIILALLIAMNITLANAQEWKQYFQFGIGTGYLMDANIKDSPLLQFEYGRSYKWLDLSAVVESAREYDKSSNSGTNYVSLNLKTKFDIVRMFAKDTRHSFKLGTGLGIGATKLSNWYDLPDDDSSIFKVSSVMASYEFRIVEKTWLGVFFNNYTDDTFFGMHYLGLSVRYNF